MNIVVLSGGLSPERDVSLSSGAKIAAALRSRGHRVCLLDLFMGLDPLPEPLSEAFSAKAAPDMHAVSEVAPDLAAVQAARAHGLSSSVGSGVLDLCRAADLTFLALHGGDGENGKLQALFDLLDIRYTGSSSLGCAVAMHKWVSKQLLESAGIPVPRGALLRRGQKGGDFPLPCVVKPCCGGSSIGIAIARTPAEYEAALADAFRYEEEVLVEEYIAGRELSAGMLGGEALPLIEIIPRDGFYDYAHKYQAGWTEEITPAPLDAETTARIQALSLDACRALGLSVYARVDFLLAPDGRIFCLEANTLPGMTPTSLLPQEAAAAGIDYPSLCDRIVRLSERKADA